MADPREKVDGDPPCLLVKRRDGSEFDLETWRRVATECGAEITDAYQAINPFTQKLYPAHEPGSGLWHGEQGTLHLRYRVEDVHIRHPCDSNDPSLVKLAAAIDAEIAAEDSFADLLRQLENDPDRQQPS